MVWLSPIVYFPYCNVIMTKYVSDFPRMTRKVPEKAAKCSQLVDFSEAENRH